MITLLVVALLPMQMSANEEAGKAHGEELNIPEIVLEHLSDDYEWHVATYEGKHISIPLPVIVRSENTGQWHFCTKHSLPETFFINHEQHGKIYEKMTDGSVVRPLDLSITKAVAQIWIVVIVLISVFLYCAKWYKTRNEKSNAPKGFVGVMEMLVMTINDDLIKSTVGEKHYKQYAPYLLTVFFFIFTTNLIGLLPIFPGGANVTGNINVTLFLAVCTMLAINLFGNKEYWKEIFWPDVPIWLKCPLPIMQAIEVFGMFTKPAALCVRLFANMMGGHMIVIVLTLLIFIFASFGPVVTGGITAFSVLFSLFMLLLDTLVSFIQAYVFTMLSTLFISMAVCDPHESHHSEE